MDKDCIFCKIIRGEIKPPGKIYEDDHVFIFLSNGPVHLGHTLVIPKSHVPQVYGFTEETASRIGVALSRFSEAVKKAVEADGINIHMNNEKAAGQEVMHAHFHIIPRYFNDGYKNWEAAKRYKEGEADTLAEKIRESIK